MKPSIGRPVFLAVVILVLVTIVIYMTQTNEMMKELRRIPWIHTRNKFESTNPNKPRLNVIVLTHMSSGSTVVGNMFNLHPDVFYIYEPLHRLRRIIYRNEWHALEKSRNDAFTKDFSTLLPDLFTCGFHENSTIKLVFPKWVRSYNAWYNSSKPFTEDSLREACFARKITVTKIMQTRLPREVGIRELERVCSSDPSKFDCLIIHLVRDPRAVLSSLIRRNFFMGQSYRELLTQKPMSPEGISLLKQNAQVLCSLVLDNLEHVNKESSNWFKSHYILVRYEDAISNMSKVVDDMYKFVGLRMVDAITNWIQGIQPTGRQIGRNHAFVLSNTDVATIDQWRFRENSSLVSLYEEACGSLMEVMGYILVNGSEYLQHNNSIPLRTENIPLLKDLPRDKNLELNIPFLGDLPRKNP